jgi:hypothetical protein
MARKRRARRHVSVLELRGGAAFRSRCDSKDGLVTITGLTPGEYAVELAPTASTTVIRVGRETVSGHLMATR